MFLFSVNAPEDWYAWIIGTNANGRSVRNLQDPEGRPYANITAAVESDGVLCLGSTEARAVGRYRLDSGRAV